MKINKIKENDEADPYTDIDAIYDYITIISDGTNWHIIAKYITP